MAYTDYLKALKIGKNTVKSLGGDDKYLPVLESKIAGEPPMSQVRLGLVEMPIELIKGTYTAGRTRAFAADFMPLLEPDTEFASKWSELYDSLCEKGQRDPVIAYEYLNHFYLVEGNKRVSVQKYMGAAAVEGIVIRLIPQRPDEDDIPKDEKARKKREKIKIYYEFLDFYDKTRINYILMSREGNYEKLYRHVHPEGDDRITDDEALELKFIYCSFKKIYFEKGGGKISDIRIGDQLLNYIDIYGYESVRDQTTAEMRESIEKVWPEFLMFSNRKYLQMVEGNGNDAREQKKSIAHSIAHIIAGGVNNIANAVTNQQLKVAFVHFKDPADSGWSYRHEHERRKVQEKFGDRIETKSFSTLDSSDGSLLENLISEGYKVIFTTSPVLSGISLRCAIDHPDIVICNCSLNNAYVHMRSYYLRVYEAKFILGAIAGSVSKNNRIGYIADYPIFGALAAVNAFALGARTTNPYAKVYLEWSSQKGRPAIERLLDLDVDIISKQDVTAPNVKAKYTSEDDQSDAGLFTVKYKNGTPVMDCVAAPKLYWSVLYESLIRSVLNGDWKYEDSSYGSHGLNYYWGMSTGAIDVQTYDLPFGVGQIAYFLKNNVAEGKLNPFSSAIFDQKFSQKNTTSHCMTASDIINIDWLESHIVGDIPDISEFVDSSHELISLLGVKLSYKPEDPAGPDPENDIMEKMPDDVF